VINAQIKANDAEVTGSRAVSVSIVSPPPRTSTAPFVPTASLGS
jgi:hypothetical protein